MSEPSKLFPTFSVFLSYSNDKRLDGVNFFLFSWLLYEKPGFQGRIIALEEGPTDRIVNMWAEEGTPTALDQMGQPVPTAPMVIGSLRLAVRVSADVILCTCC